MPTLFEDNSELRNKRFPIPDGVRKHLSATLAEYDGDKTIDGYKRLNNLLASKGVSYRDMKRIKNFFDTYRGTNKSADYILNGGDTMRCWVENTLGRARKSIEDFKRAKKEAGISNAYIRPHEKDRQRKKNKPTTTRFHATNRNFLDANTIKYEAHEHTMKKRIRINEAKLKELIRTAVNEAFDGLDNDLDYESVNTQAYDYLCRNGNTGMPMKWRSIAKAIGFRLDTIGPNDMETLKDAIEDAMMEYGSPENTADRDSYGVKESALRNRIKSIVEAELLTDGDEYGADHWDVSNELERLGWCYVNSFDVQNRNNGQTGVRYELEPNGGKSADENTLKRVITRKFGKDKVFFSTGTHRYAPEITRLSLIVID